MLLWERIYQWSYPVVNAISYEANQSGKMYPYRNSGGMVLGYQPILIVFEITQKRGFMCFCKPDQNPQQGMP